MLSLDLQVQSEGLSYVKNTKFGNYDETWLQATKTIESARLHFDGINDNMGIDCATNPTQCSHWTSGGSNASVRRIIDGGNRKNDSAGPLHCS